MKLKENAQVETIGIHRYGFAVDSRIADKIRGKRGTLIFIPESECYQCGGTSLLGNDDEGYSECEACSLG